MRCGKPVPNRPTIRRMLVQPIEVAVAEDVLDDLRARLRATRWPDPAPGAAWSQGVDLEFLRGFAIYWAEEFDWRAAERELNRYPHGLAQLREATVHFVRHRGEEPRPALLLIHGWPSTFAEYLPVMDRLADEFDLVAMAPPGYPFSPRPDRVGIDRSAMAGLAHQLMQGLGYARYGVHGADFGAGIATAMAMTDPDRITGIHLSTAEMSPYLGPDAPPLTQAEQAYAEHVERWDATERGYSTVQSTRPQTLGYALTDSPAGMAAWMLDKWRSWSDSGGDLASTFGCDQLATMLTLWWASGSVTAAMRDYFDNRWHAAPLGPDDRVRVPTAFALFPNEFVPEGEPPRSWYERLYAVERWTVFSRGGHFAALEVPDTLADDIRAFFHGRP
jgi:pimeloyl-ACP methyl ester carboxylesterase